MNDQKLYKLMDRELEKLAMLLSIEEGLFGLYQLFENINHYSFLTIADKYAIVYDLLNEILTEELATLEEFTDPQLTTKAKDIDLANLSVVLDNPRSWDLNARPIYTLCLTSKGEHYLDDHSTELRQLKERDKLG